MVGLSASTPKWDVLVQRAKRAWLMRSQTCYLFVRCFNHKCTVWFVGDVAPKPLADAPLQRLPKLRKS